MKKRVLLIDESLTVQKVVALTLDKSRYVVSYAKSRAEAMSIVADSNPNLILVSDQVSDITVSSFPNEAEAWIGGASPNPPIILITSQDMNESRNYVAVLRKPFSPQALQALVDEHAQTGEEAETPDETLPNPEDSLQEVDDQNLQARFQDTFNDEARLVRETFQTEIANEERTLLTIPAPGDGIAAQKGFPIASSTVNSPTAGSFDARGAAEGTISSQDPPAGSSFSNEVPVSQPLSPPLASPPPDTAPQVRENLWQPSAQGTQPSPPPAGSPSLKNPPPAPTQTVEPHSHAPHPPLREREPPLVMGAEDSMAYKAVLESKVEEKLREDELYRVVDQVLEKLVPPIVERLVKERLDSLLKEEDDFVELKP